MASSTLNVLLLVALASIVIAVPLGKSGPTTPNIKVTIKDGQSQTIRCADAGKVVAIVDAIYTNQSPKSTTSSSGLEAATPCNSDTGMRRTVRKQCKDMPSCTIKASDDVLLGFDTSKCKTRRPLIVEYQCAGGSKLARSDCILPEDASLVALHHTEHRISWRTADATVCTVLGGGISSCSR